MLEKILNEIISKKQNIIGYGSPAKATTALNFFGISKEIDYVIEDNILKQGKYIPGVNIEIKSKNKINDRIDNLLVLELF